MRWRHGGGLDRCRALTRPCVARLYGGLILSRPRLLKGVRPRLAQALQICLQLLVLASKHAELLLDRLRTVHPGALQVADLALELLHLAFQVVERTSDAVDRDAPCV